MQRKESKGGVSIRKASKFELVFSYQFSEKNSLYTSDAMDQRISYALTDN